jgi:hypothetical protein
MLISVLTSPNMQIDINIPELNPEVVRVHVVIYIFCIVCQKTLLILTATKFFYG